MIVKSDWRKLLLREQMRSVATIFIGTPWKTRKKNIISHHQIRLATLQHSMRHHEPVLNINPDQSLLHFVTFCWSKYLYSDMTILPFSISISVSSVFFSETNLVEDANTCFSSFGSLLCESRCRPNTLLCSIRRRVPKKHISSLKLQLQQQTR